MKSQLFGRNSNAYKKRAWKRNYFIHHFDKEEKFQGGQLTDARLYGDGYDFQVDVQEHSYLAELKVSENLKDVFV